MKYIIDWRLWEEKDLNRLVQLGLVEDKNPIDWLYEILDGDPEFEVWPVMTRLAWSVMIDNRRTGSTLNISITSEPGYGRPVSFRVGCMIPDRPTRVKQFDIPEGLSNLEIAERIIGALRSEYSAEPVEESLSRLANLGLTPDLDFTGWIQELAPGIGDFQVHGLYPDDDSIYLVYRPTRELIGITLRRRLSGAPKGLSIIYTHSSRNSGASDIQKLVRVEPNTTPLQAAELAISEIKRHLHTPLGESIDELQRLHDLGLSPDFTIVDWLEKLLEGHPDFLIERTDNPLGQTCIVVRDWAPTDIVVRVMDRVIDQHGTRELTGVKLWYLNAHGTSSSPYQLTPDQVRLGPGNLGMAQGIAKILDEYYSRKAVGVEESLQESDSSFDRLLELGLIEVKAWTPWGITVARLQHRFPELSIKSRVSSKELEITDPAHWSPEGNNINKVILHAEWSPGLGEGASRLELALHRAGQWQPIHNFSKGFAFDTVARTTFGREVDPVWISNEFAELISEYVEAWLLKYYKDKDENTKF